MSNKQSLLKIVLPLLIIVVAGISAKLLLNLRQPPQKEEHVDRGFLVQVMTVDTSDVVIPLKATGTVSSGNEMDVTAEVTARVNEVSDNFVAGGFVNQGDLLFSLERTDFELALEKAKAEKEKIRLELTILENQATVARDQWHQIHPDKAPHPLTVYKPQLINAKAQLAAAEASIRQAELNLRRTQVFAPFSGLIVEKNIGLGQYVRAGNILGHIIDSSLAEVNIPLPLNDLAWLKIPGKNTDTKGSVATITMNLGSQKVSWQGRLTRSLGTIDSQTRMTTVVVRVDDPYGLKTTQPFPLVNGAFVDVDFSGITLSQVVSIPRGALRADSKVWTVDTDNRLQVQPVVIARKLHDRVLIKSGLKAGDKVVVSALAGAADGMKLRAIEVEDNQ